MRELAHGVRESHAFPQYVNRVGQSSTYSVSEETEF